MNRVGSAGFRQFLFLVMRKSLSTKVDDSATFYPKEKVWQVEVRWTIKEEWNCNWCMDRRKPFKKSLSSEQNKIDLSRMLVGGDKTGKSSIQVESSSRDTKATYKS